MIIERVCSIDLRSFKDLQQVEGSRSVREIVSIQEQLRRLLRCYCCLAPLCPWRFMCWRSLCSSKLTRFEAAMVGSKDPASCPC